ncbi:PAS domain-containing sensor histidine kinase [Desulfobacter hydrogenophilus]|uniref:histidine kinase n=1 Tax=Desulfobacter hydrogenophilus TaxID=2291 RepID=A0A328FDW0_9BACT|nr:ATP-binding protein [Desulfobacter hydrogenophilus]NDY71337.1 PAS domain-containing protein [Desulfobacter hydrogenophilus]QBH12264.1 PAS domain-containing protein [Desulfobacter hydrogenophilus]RAM01225.1 PAS domain-containing sensor histidine kinase [Desulfobacter hydrogenophilus]
MMSDNKRPYPNRSISPWVIIGISVVLVGVVVTQAAMNYNREKKYMGQILSEKGAALIRSFEAGTITGMMGRMGSEAHLQTLLEETAAQKDISYIVITDQSGIVLAHNQKNKIGAAFTPALSKADVQPSDRPQWRTVKGQESKDYFEVYKTFLPTLRGHGQHGQSKGLRRHMVGRDHMDGSHEGAQVWIRGQSRQRLLDPENRPAIFIGMDIAPFEHARKEDLQNSTISIVLILFLGLGGIVSLFWAQNHARSRRLLLDTRAFASELVTSLPMGIVAVDDAAKVIYVNGTAALFLRKELDQIKGKKAAQVLPPSLLTRLDQVDKGGFVSEQELKLPSHTGKSIPVTVTITKIVGTQNNFIGHVFILNDLSRIRALELEIKQKEKLAAVGILAAGVAHEVRNPLSSIKGYATYFSSLFDPQSDNKKAANIMAEEVDRVNRVISELLEFTRPIQLELKKTRIFELVDKALRLIKYEADPAGIKIINSVEPNLPEVEVDKDRLTQVLLNIFINAIQAMPSGGTLTVNVKAMENRLQFEISDTGGGISPQDQANIFNPYFTTKKRGTGLGLAIAFKIIETHGGTITIESLKNKGTTFVISIPMKQNKPGQNKEELI